MTNDDKEHLSNLIDCNGFDYTFEDYSDFEEIDDKKFHQLRKNYLNAAKELREYIEYQS